MHLHSSNSALYTNAGKVHKTLNAHISVCPPTEMDGFNTKPTIITCHYHHHNHHHHLSLSSPQPPPPVTIIITTTIIGHYHHHNYHHLSLSSTQPPPCTFKGALPKGTTSLCTTTTSNMTSASSVVRNRE